MPSMQFINSLPNNLRRVRLFKRITTIGRENTNDVPIPEPSVDDNHAYIAFDGKHYTISGVGKKNVILINGKREKNYRLTHEDVVTLGDVNFSFDLFDEIANSEEEQIQTEIRTYRKLYQFTEKLISNYNIEELLNQLIDAVIEITGADKGFLILKKDDQGLEFAVARNVNRESIANALTQVSDSIVGRVVQSKRPVIVSDALNDETFKNAQSVMKLELASVMCAPILARGSFLGILYVGNNNVINLFTPDKLQLLEIFAGQAALLIQNALLVNELKLDRRELQERIEQLRFGSMVGTSAGMREVFKKIEKVASVNVPVLIQGETGTGKELVAQEVHNKSDRRNGPFVVINCGAIPRDLLESELFGHVKGAFTGAVATTPGKFKMADGGTLFLDEIGDMPMELQVKLLRALEDGKIVPVGDTRPEVVDIRIIAASNKPLVKAIKDNEFREDLYYRLNVITVTLPPLREREGDVTLIAKYFLNRYANEYGRKIRGFSQKALDMIVRHQWPGNVRELENRIKKAVIMADKNLVEPEDLDLNADELEPIVPLAQAREDFQTRYIQEALRRHNGNRTKTAQALDVDPRTIFRYLEKMTD